MTIIRANISIPQCYMSGCIIPAMSGKYDDALLACKLCRSW